MSESKRVRPFAYIPFDAIDQMSPPRLTLRHVPLLSYAAEGHAAIYSKAHMAIEYRRGWDECMELWADHMRRMNEALSKPLPDGLANDAYHLGKNVREAPDAAPTAAAPNVRAEPETTA
jgi:hypothetical protein